MSQDIKKIINELQKEFKEINTRSAPLDLTQNTYNQIDNKLINFDFDEKKILEGYKPEEVLEFGYKGRGFGHINYILIILFKWIEDFCVYQVEMYLDQAYKIIKETPQIEEYIQAVAYHILKSKQLYAFDKSERTAYLEYATHYISNFKKMYEVYKDDNKRKELEIKKFDKGKNYPQFRKFDIDLLSYCHQKKFLDNLKSQKNARVIWVEDNYVEEAVVTKELISLDQKILYLFYIDIHEDKELVERWENNYEDYIKKHTQYLKDGKKNLKKFNLTPPFKINSFTMPMWDEKENFYAVLSSPSIFDKFINFHYKIYVSEDLIIDYEKPLCKNTQRVLRKYDPEKLTSNLVIKNTDPKVLKSVLKEKKHNK